MVLLLTIPPLVLLWRGLISNSQDGFPQSEAILSAIGLSLVTTGISALLMVLFGTPLAYVLTRVQFPGRQIARVLVELPIVMPPAVAGLALLLTFGRRGLFGDWLLDAGITIPFTALAVILAQLFVSAPFYIRAAQVGFASIDRDLEDAARVDGANPGAVLRYITLPLSGRALIAGLSLGWARAMGEFGATILFAGNFEGRTRTMPLLVYSVFERDLDAAIWTGLILIGLALMALLLAQALSPDREEKYG